MSNIHWCDMDVPDPPKPDLPDLEGCLDFVWKASVFGLIVCVLNLVALVCYYYG